MSLVLHLALLGTVWEPSCTGMLRVCNGGEDSHEPSGTQVCRPNLLQRPTLRLSVGNWNSTLLNAWVAQILLQEQMQVPVVVVEYENLPHSYYVHDGQPPNFPPRSYNWQALLNAQETDGTCEGFPTTVPGVETSLECSHAFLEIWDGQKNARKEHVATTGQVVDGGILGTLGQIGWYLSAWQMQEVPSLASYRGYKDNETTKVLQRPQRWAELCSMSVAGGSSSCVTYDALVAAAQAGEDIIASEDAEALLELRNHFFVALSDIPAGAAEAFESQLGTSLPDPLYGGAFTPQYDSSGTRQIGHMCTVGCTWTAYDRQIITENELALHAEAYASTEIGQILSASVSGAAALP